MSDLLPVTPATRVHRLPERQSFDRSALNDVLDAGQVAHVAIVREDRPVVLPLLYGRDGDRLVLHGSTGGGLLRAVADGQPLSVTVTVLDGLVFARSMFHSSANYRSAVVFGTARVLEGDAKLEGLRVLSEHLMPGRWDEVRPIIPKELAATLVLELPLDEASVKVRTGNANNEDDAPDDASWYGVVPLRLVAGTPLAGADVDASLPVPPSVAKLAAAYAPQES